MHAYVYAKIDRYTADYLLREMIESEYSKKDKDTAATWLQEMVSRGLVEIDRGTLATLLREMVANEYSEKECLPLHYNEDEQEVLFLERGYQVVKPLDWELAPPLKQTQDTALHIAMLKLADELDSKDFSCF